MQSNGHSKKGSHTLKEIIPNEEELTHTEDNQKRKVTQEGNVRLGIMMIGHDALMRGKSKYGQYLASRALLVVDDFGYYEGEQKRGSN